MLESLKKSCERFREEIAEITFQEDVRCRCYDVFIDYLDYFESILAMLLNVEKEKRRNWGGKASKQILVSLISAIEYSMKKIIQMYPKTPLYQRLKEDNNGNDSLSLRKIVGASGETGILNRVQKHTLENIIDIRNMLVHHNAICETNGIKIIGEVRVEMKKGQSLSITVKELLEIIKIAIEIFHIWNVSLASSRYRRSYNGVWTRNGYRKR